MAALKRISEDTFGQCLNCEQEINAKRLEAIPWVRHCITLSGSKPPTPAV
jgi:DnaK suppressor protein